jgi:DNA-binding MarR family transcriptional regulator
MDLSDNILWLLKQAFYRTLTMVNDTASHDGVPIAQIGVLRQLADEPGLSGAQLARRLLISPQGARTALAALERRGLVERRHDPGNGRILQAYLSEKGHSVATGFIAEAVASQSAVFGVLDADEQQTLRELLGRVVEQGTGHRFLPDHVDLSPDDVEKF